MNAWLDDPASFAPGTEMSYPGIKNTQERANVVAYLRTLAANPLKLPTAAEIKAASAPPPAWRQARGRPAPAPAAPPSIDTMFANADIAKGQALVNEQCASCHSVE